MKVSKAKHKRSLSVSTCTVPSKTKKSSGLSSSGSSGSNYQGHVKRFSEIQVIVDELEKKHSDSYTPEQLRAWAHMIDLKKHLSYDTPPLEMPFFKKPSTGAKSEVAISPGERIMYRTECINQLDKWYNLLEKGAITQSQFQELQDTILPDIKQI